MSLLTFYKPEKNVLLMPLLPDILSLFKPALDRQEKTYYTRVTGFHDSVDGNVFAC